MVFSIDGFEFEIRKNEFVCLDDGEKSRFCEWRSLDPKLQEVFRAIKEELLVVIEKFLVSDNHIAFTEVAEEYSNVKLLKCHCSSK